MNNPNPVEFLQSQKAVIDENIQQLSKRCAILRSRREELLAEKEALLNTHVTVDDFIGCMVGSIRKKKEFYANQLMQALGSYSNKDFLEHPTYEKMTNEKILSSAAGIVLSNQHYPGETTLDSIFYMLNDLIADGVEKTLKEQLRPGKRRAKSFDTGKPMEEIATRLTEIDGEVDKIDEEVDELIRGAGLFGAEI